MKKWLIALFSLTLLLFCLAGCAGQDAAKTIKVGATPVPHAEILEIVKPLLEKEGYQLEIIEFTDYVQPNIALNDKEIDANFFQHLPYLNNFTSEHKEMQLSNAGGIHIEPMGIYSRKFKSLSDLKDGAVVAIPNDPTNGGRSLLLLEKAGLLKLTKDAGMNPTIQDIAENNKNLQFQEVEAAQVPRTLDDVDAALINTNYAIQASLAPTKDALLIEDSSSPYVNIVAVRKGDEKQPKIEALMKALQGEQVKKFINEKYKGVIVPAF